MPTGTKPPIPVGYARCACEGAYGPATWVNVFYFFLLDFDPTVLHDVDLVLQDAVENFYKNVMTLAGLPNTWTLDTTRVAFRDTSSSIHRTDIADALAGSYSGGTQDAQVAYLINWSSGDPRKGGKPRQYVPGVPDAAMGDVARLSSYETNRITTNIATWLASLSGITHGTAVGCQLVEMSFVNGKAYRTPVATATPIRAGHCNRVVATQRRRVDRLRS